MVEDDEKDISERDNSEGKNFNKDFGIIILEKELKVSVVGGI